MVTLPHLAVPLVHRIQGARPSVLLLAACLSLATTASAGEVLLLVGGDNLTASDLAVKGLAEELGHSVTVQPAGSMQLPMTAGKDLLMISRSVENWTPPPDIERAGIPVVSWSIYSWEPLGMIEGGSSYYFTEQNPARQFKYLDVNLPDHPLAGGLSGTVRVCTTYANIRLAYPGSMDGQVVAQESENWYAGIFSFELGSQLAFSLGIEAPARRVGLFHCEEPVSSLTDNGRALSKAAITWAMAPAPPRIHSHPLSQNLQERQSAVFSVAAHGTPPLSYQWLKDGNPIPGANQPSYTTHGSSREDSGKTFRCIVNNVAGTDTSEPAILSVQPRGIPASTDLVSIAGELTGADGAPVGVGTPVSKDVVIRIFTAPTGGTPVHEEAFLASNNQGVQVKDGRFVVRMGQGASLTEFQDILALHPDLHTEFQVGTPGGPLETLAPRIPVTAPAVAGTPRMIRGAGHPTTPAQVGTLYQNASDNSVWVRVPHTWVRITPPENFYGYQGK